MVPAFFRQLSLRSKLYLNLGLLCAVLGTVATLASWGMSLSAQLGREALKTSVRQADLAARVAEWTLQCRRFEKDVFLNVHDPAAHENYKKDWLDAFARLTATIEAFRAAAPGTEDQAAARAWEAAAENYQQAMRHIFDGVQDGSIRTPVQANEAVIPFKDSIRELTVLATETSSRKMNEAHRTEDDVTNATLFLQYVMFGVTLAAVLACLVWCYFQTVDLTRPLAALCEAARRVGAGDLYARVDLQREDELGQLADCFNQMTANLREHAAEKKA
jgi:methyl-accepting chemotaxis protein